MVESTRLESERAGNRTVGSNPTLSANKITNVYAGISLSLFVLYSGLYSGQHS